MKKNFLTFFLALSFLFPSYSALAEAPVAGEAEAEGTEAAEEDASKALPTLCAEAAILMDAKTGQILYEKNSHEKEYPASITKLMTVLLALENGKLTDTLTFSHDAVYSIEQGSAHIAIQEGEELTLEQTLRAILLRSANEASNGVAEYVDGSMEAFAQHMTKRAKELGCENTNFLNANGLFNENHYTTAYDMALIARALYGQEAYRAIMSDTYYEIPPTNKQEETRYLHGQHQMLNKNSLYYYEYAIGGKTGYTSEALNTLVTFAKKGEMELIAVVMKCNGAEHYVDTKALFDYGFEQFESVKLLSAAEHTKSIAVTETQKKKTTTLDTISAAPAEDISYILPKGTDLSTLKIETDCPETIEAPVKEGDTIGTLKLSLAGKTLTTVDLKASKTVDLPDEAERAAEAAKARKALLKKIGIVFLCVLLALCILFCITRTIGDYRRKKRRAERRKRRNQTHRRQ